MPSPPHRSRPRAIPLAGELAPADALARIGDRRAPVLLDSAGGEPCRWSWLGLDPIEWSELGPESAPEWTARLRELASRLSVEGGDDVPGPFAGGWLGALAYDLGVAGEGLALPREPWGQPLIAGGLFTDFLVRDERARRTWLVLDEAERAGRAPLAERRAELLAALHQEPERGAGPAGATRALGPLVRCTSGEVHRARVERARALIAEGEIYQANLAHRLTRRVAGRPADIYARLRAANRAPYMGYLRLAEGALLSASPELLLELDGGVARTRPIKGTIARGATPEEDAQRARALLASRKDLAELAMIVDLERNDLGRIAEPGSVRAEGFPTLQSYASVHHLVADVSARARAGIDAIDVLAAIFPGGSITGAPKLRSMEAIAELEGEGRGFFCGALGYLDARGGACFDILIRTLLWRPRPELGPSAGEVSFRVGGGVTWSSDPAAEDEETLAKAASLAAALEDSS